MESTTAIQAGHKKVEEVTMRQKFGDGALVKEMLAVCGRLRSCQDAQARSNLQDEFAALNEAYLASAGFSKDHIRLFLELESEKRLRGYIDPDECSKFEELCRLDGVREGAIATLVMILRTPKTVVDLL